MNTKRKTKIEEAIEQTKIKLEDVRERVSNLQTEMFTLEDILIMLEEINDGDELESIEYNKSGWGSYNKEEDHKDLDEYNTKEGGGRKAHKKKKWSDR